MGVNGKWRMASWLISRIGYFAQQSWMFSCMRRWRRTQGRWARPWGSWSSPVWRQASELLEGQEWAEYSWPSSSLCLGGTGRLWGQTYSATGQGRIIQRVRIPPRKVSQPPGSESLEGGR